jgi:SulP family sulfate permease
VFLRGFECDQPAQDAVIDVLHAHFWDITAVGALDNGY